MGKANMIELIFQERETVTNQETSQSKSTAESHRKRAAKLLRAEQRGPFTPRR